MILVREMNERLGLSDLIAQHVTDPRGKNTQFPQGKSAANAAMPGIRDLGRTRTGFRGELPGSGRTTGRAGVFRWKGVRDQNLKFRSNTKWMKAVSARGDTRTFGERVRSAPATDRAADELVAHL